MQHLRLGWLLALSACLLGAGCVVSVSSIVKPIDQESLVFRSALEEETQRLLASGQTRREAEARAQKTVTKRFSKEAAEERIALAQPLLAALRELEKPRGCWAYTVTTKSTENEITSITVERFNPFEPEQRLWTLVSRNGQPPDENAQRAYRKNKLRGWRRSLKHPKSPAADVEKTLGVIEITHTASEFTGLSLYSVWAPAMSMRGVIDIQMPARMSVYSLDADGRLQSQTVNWLGPFSMSPRFVRKIIIEDMISTSEYTLVDPNLPPFLSRHSSQFRITAMQSTRAMQSEIVYSDYRRVKCYDERFEVNVGAPEMIDFLPTSK